MRVTVLAGGVGGARFLRGLRHHLCQVMPDGANGTTATITAIINTGDDMWLTGLRVCPDLDSVMYALAGVNDEERGWGRAGETERVSAELTALWSGLAVVYSWRSGPGDPHNALASAADRAAVEPSYPAPGRALGPGGGVAAHER
jgi:hypothetical protein